MKNNEYIKARYNRMEMFLRVCFGIRQLIQRPYYNLILLVMLVLFTMMWKWKGQVILMLSIPVSLIPLFQQLISVVLVLLLILLLLAFLKQLGVLAARCDECPLIIAFSANDLRNGVPILTMRKKIKGTDVVVREFYSNIPMSKWQERKAEIEDAFNGHFVKPFIEYGGRHKNNSKRIVTYIASGRMSRERGIMYDREL